MDSVKKIFFYLICILNIVLDFLISNCNRDFGNKNDVPQNSLFILGILFGTINGSSRFLWGYLMDKFGFKILMLIITSIEIIIAATLYFSVQNDILYIISVLLISACLGGHFAILSPVFNKIFGLEKGPEMYGLTGNCIGIASVSGPLMSNFVLKNKQDFLIVFLVGGALCVVKFVVLIFFNENDKFKYKANANNLMDNEKNKNDEKEPIFTEGERISGS